MTLKKAISVTEITPGTMKHVSVDGTEILMANVDGNFYAINNVCPHMGGSLAEGKLEGSIVRCPKHGAMFDVTTGKNTGPAKIAFMKMKVKDTQSYQVKVEGDDVFVEVA